MNKFTNYCGTEALKDGLICIPNKEFEAKFPGQTAKRCDHYSKYVAYNENGELRPVTRMIRYSRTAKPHKCGARCRQAKSGDCECQCGGKFHGAGMDAK